MSFVFVTNPSGIVQIGASAVKFLGGRDVDHQPEDEGLGDLLPLALPRGLPSIPKRDKKKRNSD